ncbi:MAG: ABC-F family ATP-binding cassette domain-containing protein [Phycisphaerales bacterium JB039]
MPAIAATNLHLAYGSDIILEGCSLSIEPGERIGLVGRNGAGKTSLMRIMAGELKPDSGDVAVQRGMRVRLLRQDPRLDPDETLRGEAESGFAELHDLHRQMDAVYARMEGAGGADLEALLAQQADLESKINALGGYAVDHRVDATLHGLGFADGQFSIPVRGLSGGQRARLALAKLLLEGPDILLLDEPSNHLDLDGRIWLETFLVEEYRGAVLMITHDRTMLDRVAQRIVEVEHGRLISYPGSYSAFRQLRAERRQTQLEAWEKQQSRFRKEEEYIRRFKAGQRAKQARGRETRLEREKQDQRIERPQELGVFRFQLPQGPRPGDLVVTARGLTKRYPRAGGGVTTLFEDLSITIGRGERWAIIGPNGAGKSTLVACLLGEMAPDAGTSRLGSNVRTGFFRQEEDGLDPDLPVCRYLQNVILKENPGKPMSEQEARDLAGAFLFSGDEQDRALGEMSGGERARARLAALLASAKNLVVLDEPTNHLDIPSAERLEAALAIPRQDPDTGERTGPEKAPFAGTLILISHDRTLIDATCDHLIVLDGRGGAEIFHGGYSAYAAARRAPAEASEAPGASKPAERREPAATASRDTVSAPAAPAKKRKSPHSWMSSEQLETRIAELEGQVARLDRTLGDPEIWKDAVRAAALTDERAELKSALGALEEEWLGRI